MITIFWFVLFCVVSFTFGYITGLLSRGRGA